MHPGLKLGISRLIGAGGDFLDRAAMRAAALLAGKTVLNAQLLGASGVAAEKTDLHTLSIPPDKKLRKIIARRPDMQEPAAD
jgi:hypothetical protein